MTVISCIFKHFYLHDSFYFALKFWNIISCIFVSHVSFLVCMIRNWCNLFYAFYFLLFSWDHRVYLGIDVITHATTHAPSLHIYFLLRYVVTLVFTVSLEKSFFQKKSSISCWQMLLSEYEIYIIRWFCGHVSPCYFSNTDTLNFGGIFTFGTKQKSYMFWTTASLLRKLLISFSKTPNLSS